MSNRFAPEQGGRGMDGDRTISKLGQLVALSVDEKAALARIQRRETRLAKGVDLVTQGEADDCAYVLQEGWALRFRHLKDGRRQILNFLLPGDWVGLTAILFREADHSVSLVTEGRVAPVSVRDMTSLFHEHPRLAMAIYWTAAQEEAVVAEHLVDVGRRTAYERMGHLFLEIYLRLAAVGAASGNAFEFPLNQMALADALGLSQVHVNRTLQRLRKDGLVELYDRRAVILDRDRLETLVEFENTYLHLAGLPVWLRKRLFDRASEADVA